MFSFLIILLTNGREQDMLTGDPNSSVSQETLKDLEFCKKLKSEILTMWTNAQSMIKTEVKSETHSHAAKLNPHCGPDHAKSW